MDRRDRHALSCLAGVLGISILAVGGAPRWAQAAAIVPALAGLVVVWSSRRGLARVSPVLALLGVALAWTLVQLVPLPGSLTTAASPTLSALRASGLALAGLPPTSTLTMDVPGSLRAVAMLMTLLAVAIIALRLAVTERGRYWLVAAVGGIIAVGALVALAHQVSGATHLYGLYVPRGGTRVLGPLLNPNHLGCLMAVGLIVNAALAVHARQPTPRRVGFAAAALACLAAIASTTSRGAILALGLGMVTLLVTLFAQRAFAAADRVPRQRREVLMTRTLPIGVLIACGLVVALYVGATGVISQLQGTSIAEIHAPTSKFAAWRSALVLAGDAPLVGVGRGAFEPTFTRVHAASAFATFSHAENVIVQALVEWGAPITIALGVLAGWLAAVALRRWRDGAPAAGALGALACVAFQSNFDFAIEILGVAVPVVVLAASLCYVPLKEVAAARIPRLRIARAIQAILLLGAGLMLLGATTRTIEDDHHDLDATSPPDAVAAAIRRHPLDYYPYAVRAEQLVRARDPRGAVMLNHALRLHPTHPGLHRLAARVLASGKRWDQVQSELAIAIRFSADARPILADVVQLLPTDRAAGAIPVEREVAPIVQALAELHREDIAILWLDEVLVRHPSTPAATTLYSLAVGRKDFAGAARAQAVRCNLAPSDRCTIDRARLLVQASQSAAALALLADVPQWHGRRDEQLEAWLLLCDTTETVTGRTAALECLRRLQGSGLGEATAPAITTRLEALQAP